MGLNTHTAVLLKDSSVKTVGHNSYGQLGLGNTSNVLQFQSMPLTGVKQIATGFQFTILLMNDGTVRSFGYGAYGQLGNGLAVSTTTNIQTPPIQNVKAVVCGMYHTIFLMEDGSVKGVGNNENGQLSGVKASTVTAIRDIPIVGVKQVACGEYHTMFLMEDGTVKVLGKNHQGQLGTGDYSEKNVLTNINITGVKKIACGASHTVFLKDNGTVQTVGYNYYGQLGNGSSSNLGIYTLQNVNVTDVKDIDCGYDFTMLLMNDGTVKGFGRNNKGQLGKNNTSTYEGSPVNSVVTGVKQISCGYEYSIFLLENADLKLVGDNQYGQLSLNNTITPQTTIQTVVLRDISLLQGQLAKVIKYLIKDGVDIKIHKDGVWYSLGIEPLVKSYINQGMSSLTSLNKISLSELTSDAPELLVWYEEDQGSKELTMVVNGWEEVSTTLPTPEEMTLKGHADLKVIPATAWAELGGDFEVVTYTNDLDETQKLFLEAMPKSQLIQGTTDFTNVAQLALVASAGVKVVVSSDSGVTWKTRTAGNWATVAATVDAVKASGISVIDFNLITADQWAALGDKVRVAYLLEDEAMLDKITVTKVQLTDATPSFDGMQVEYEELTLEGRLKDLERLNAINLAKLNFKTNAIMQTDGYKLDDMVVDTFEKDSALTISSNVDDVSEQVFTTPVVLGDGFVSEVVISQPKIPKKIEVR